MLALVSIDHRVALVALAALLIAAAIPLAYAWALLLPDEPPPFRIEPGSFPAIDQEPAPRARTTPKLDAILTVLLLTCVTLMYLLRFPGFPNAMLTRRLTAIVSAPTAAWLFFSARISLVTAASAAVLYAIFRRSRLPAALATAALLVLLLWFLSPVLTAALLSSS